MLMAKVVLPAIATLRPLTHAQERLEPDVVGGRLKMGPAPPAVLTAQPSRAKAAMMAAMDLTKKSHLILRGWIRTKGSCTKSQLVHLRSRMRDSGREVDLRVQKTKYAIIRLLVTPTLVGMELGSVASDGQIASSMMSIHDAPM